MVRELDDSRVMLEVYLSSVAIATYVCCYLIQSTVYGQREAVYPLYWMKFSISNVSNVNTLFVGTPQDSDINNKGGNLFFGDPASFSPKVYDYIIKRFNVKSMLDVGSGLGYLPAYIFSEYHIPVIGIEGLEFNIANAIYPLNYHDLTEEAYHCSQVDLVNCVEVVEHIDPKYLDYLLDTLTRGKVLLMTHATPEQHGDFHLNEQYSDYWVEKLKTRGFGLLALDTQIVRHLAAQESHGTSYFARTGLVFARMPVAVPDAPAAPADAATKDRKSVV